MKKHIEVNCLNTGTIKMYPLGTSLSGIITDQNIQLDHPILGAMVNHQVEDLDYEIFRPKQVEFIDIRHLEGRRMYMRSLKFLLAKALTNLYPQASIKVNHSVSRAIYCKPLNVNEPINQALADKLTTEMHRIVECDHKFIREEIPITEAMTLFHEHGCMDKAKLFSTRQKLYTSIYKLDGVVDYYYGCLVPSTGYLKLFGLVPYYDGFLLQRPHRTQVERLDDIVHQEKMFEIIKEHKAWSEILGVDCIGSINEAVRNGQAGELIKISEALHEKKVAQIADMIHRNPRNSRVVLISGPSSSGKTTFAMRLAIQLKVAGLQPKLLSLDNYFVDREATPKDENGEYDFETIHALDINLFNTQIKALLDGETVQLPKYSFEDGKQYLSGETLKLNDQNILLIEGIHALNPELTPGIPSDAKFKIYVSALTQVGIDWHNRIPTTDSRLIRRIIRDYKYRGYSALDTLKRWPSVRRGEDRYIFPYQEQADIMFNSAHTYELGVLKRYATPLLKDIWQTELEYGEAQRLLKFLSYIQPLPDEEVPPTSILREFLGGSSFSYS